MNKTKLHTNDFYGGENDIDLKMLEKIINMYFNCVNWFINTYEWIIKMLKFSDEKNLNQNYIKLINEINTLFKNNFWNLNLLKSDFEKCKTWEIDTSLFKSWKYKIVQEIKKLSNAKKFDKNKCSLLEKNNFVIFYRKYFFIWNVYFNKFDILEWILISNYENFNQT